MLLEGEVVYIGAGNVCVHPQSDFKLLENGIVLRCMSHVNYFFPLVTVLRVKQMKTLLMEMKLNNL